MTVNQLNQLITPSEGKLAKIADLVRDAIRQSGISDNGAQSLIEQGGGFQREITPIIRRLANEDNPYADERRNQTHYYPEGWSVPDLSAQAKKLAIFLPGLDLSYSEKASKVVVPEGADGLALIPKLSALGRICGISDPYWSGYSRLVGHAIGFIGHREFSSYLQELQEQGELTDQYIRIHAETRKILTELEAETPGDCLVLPISFGNLYAGYSQRNAGWEALYRQQLPLGLVQVSYLLLAMPGRLTACNHLFIYCPGDEYRWYTNDDWSLCPLFYFDDKLDQSGNGFAHRDAEGGSAVAFLEV